MASTASMETEVRFRLRRSRARPAVQLVDVVLGGRTIATIRATHTGLRVVSHDRAWSEPHWSAEQPAAIEVEFAPATLRVLDLGD